MERQRLTEIDIIKAIGLIGVIAIHVLTYNLTNPISRFIWNYAQFVVVAFVFSSGYILPIAYSHSFSGVKMTLLWYKKRLSRLLVPFWIYLTIHFALWILFPSFFQGLGLKKSVDYFLQSAFLIGGTNYNFLPTLFVELSIIFPLLLRVSKSKWLSAAYITLAGAVTFYFTFFGFSYSYYRLVMWIPWSLVLFFAIWIVTKRNSKEIVENYKLLITAVVSTFWFLILFAYFKLSGASLNFYSHKYPPDFYYLLYGLGITLFLLVILKSYRFKNPSVLKFSDYISKNSYSLFFVHYIVLDCFLKLRTVVFVLQDPFLLFVSVLGVSILIVTGVTRIRALIKL